MNYYVETLPEFTLLAVSREFHMKNCMMEIPKFWEEYYQLGYGKFACGQFGLCCCGKPDGTFRYAIGNRCNVETDMNGSAVYHIFNCPDRTEIPNGFELRTIPANTWLKVECSGPLPQSIQNMYPRIQAEWPEEYERLDSMDIEEYGYCKTPEDSQKPDYRCFIWIPVKPVKAVPSYNVRLNVLTAEEYIRLFSSPGWTAPGGEQVKTALEHSLAAFSVYSEDKLIGMGRLIGDRSMSYMFRDLVILPEYQRKGAGTFLMRTMLDWLANDLPSGWQASCELFAATGKVSFYEKFGFEPLPNPFLENGMMRMVKGVK